MRKPSPPQLEDVLDDWGIQIEPPNWKKVYEYMVSEHAEGRIPQIGEIGEETGIGRNRADAAMKTLLSKGFAVRGEERGQYVAIRDACEPEGP